MVYVPQAYDSIDFYKIQFAWMVLPMGHCPFMNCSLHLDAFEIAYWRYGE